MAFLQWRRFNFFDKVSINEEAANDTIQILKETAVTCVTSGRGQIVLGDANGSVYFISRQWVLSSFIAFNIAVTHLQQIIATEYLVAVGQDEPGINPVIKIWNLEKLNADGKPQCTRVIRAISGITPSPVTAFSVLDSLTLMAVGFGDGNILLIRGDITRERHSKQKVLKCSSSAITSMDFRNNSQSQTSHKQIFLFVTSTKEIISYNLTTRDKEERIVLDNFGCDVRCACLKNDPKQSDTLYVVGRKDAIYFYQTDERGPCLAFEGEKMFLYWYRNYLVVIGKKTASTASTSIEKSPLPEGPATNIITVYDIANKLIAYCSPIPGITDIFSEWGMLYLLTTDGKLIHLRERDTQTKLEMLFSKSLFSMAIDLAKSQQYDEDALADIFKQYGDHLYKKGDHDAAISQYIHTIGRLEASYVIRKFLDAQRIHNLTAYLQALHRAGLANEDHTTLLLNCYAKLKDKTKLDEFIKDSDRGEQVDFDVEIAIKVLRQAGYFSHAIYLAEKHNRHDWYFKIQLEDMSEANEALDYMKKMSRLDATTYMIKYGRFLMSKVPDKTTELLKSLCIEKGEDENNVQMAEPADDFLSYGIGVVLGSVSNGLAEPFADVQAKPQDFIHIFVKNQDKLKEFLEHMINFNSESSPEVYNTLLQLYLYDYNHESNEEMLKRKERQIMNLLKSPSAKYDVEQAMILCQMNHFDAGLLHLYERAGLFKQILNYHITNNDLNKVLETCIEYGEQDSNLWIEALWFFSSSDDAEKLTHVLTEIEKQKLLPPIMVVDILSHSEKATIGLIKDYLIRWMTKENQQIDENEKLISQYKDDTEAMRKQIQEMKTAPKVFQASKCVGCSLALELPSVHFLCGHSYHQHCYESYVAENDECPQCLPENRQLISIIRSQENVKNLNEIFSKNLKEADDTFSVIANYFSKGIFNKPSNQANGERIVAQTSASASRPRTLNLHH